MPPQITIQIVGWNSAQELPQTLAALQRVPHDAAIIRYLDNASRDESCALVQRILPAVDILILAENKGFSGAHNIGFARCATPFVLTLNPDVELQWEGIKAVLKVFADPHVGAAQGKLYRAVSSVVDTPKSGKNIIDSAGIVHTLALNGTERGANESDVGQYDAQTLILAVTGACGIYRMEALRSVAYAGGEIFDQDFFAYKEDVDVGWRLNTAGWNVVYVPAAVGAHQRTVGRRGLFGWSIQPATVYARLKSVRTRYSLRNYVWMLAKNTTFIQGLKHEVFIDARLAVFFALSLLYLPLFTVWFEILYGLPRMLEKRKKHFTNEVPD